MFGSSKNGANAYAKVGMETDVGAASPHKLIVMLFDGALQAVLMGMQHMRAGEIALKGAAISKAINIINNGLRASLDKNAGGEIAENLDALYAYMGERLLMANLQNQPEILEEVGALLKDLKSAWEAIEGGDRVRAAAPAAPRASAAAAPNMGAYGSLAPRAAGYVNA